MRTQLPRSKLDSVIISSSKDLFLNIIFGTQKMFLKKNFHYCTMRFFPPLINYYFSMKKYQNKIHFDKKQVVDSISCAQSSEPNSVILSLDTKESFFI